MSPGISLELNSFKKVAWNFMFFCYNFLESRNLKNDFRHRLSYFLYKRNTILILKFINHLNSSKKRLFV
jgi:hypothetical protein